MSAPEQPGVWRVPVARYLGRRGADVAFALRRRRARSSIQLTSWRACLLGDATVGEVVVVAEAQVSVHSEPVPPSEPPQSETGADGVHKDAQVPYYIQGQSGVLGNPQMVVISPYHSMVRPTARYADDSHPLTMHMVRPTALYAHDAHAHRARYAHDECVATHKWVWWWSRAAARCAGVWDRAAALISTLCHAHDGTRCAGSQPCHFPSCAPAMLARRLCCASGALGSLSHTG